MPKSIPWWVGGIAMSLLFYLSFSVWGTDRPLGASTGMSYIANMLLGLKPENYKYTCYCRKSSAWFSVARTVYRVL